MLNIPKRKEILVSNAIAIGGMIALGKSTLVKGLGEAMPTAKIVFELDENDNVQKTLLRSMYDGDRPQSPDTFQVDFLLTRALRYKEALQNNKDVIFDRTIFEDVIFAHQNMAKHPHRYAYYLELWKNEANALAYTYGVPKKYVLLNASFEVFKERLFARNRKAEIDNYEKVKDYFKRLHEIYIPFMSSILEEYGVEYKVIDASQSAEKVLQDAIEFINA